ncbi:hypothetical protein [Nocardioides sp. TF02-7]|uniref:hypothetical protein n=1 Tax=Nocardioides sp. TF02-7 TaxID=2917724 RepID=UPI001F068436|nr:hypothetical protein [Nocardioides sp. TF02-7]UMG92898.1 hypothetical protein MF408_00475 [Nocardioides sp. TF02-7]
MLKDVFPGRASSSPTLLFPARKHLYFFTNRLRRQELWKTDGTRRGTVRVARLGWLNTGALTAATVGNRLFFISPTRKGWSLWRSDGTRGGTVPLRTHLKPAWEQVAESPQMVRMGGRLFFHAGDRERGKELWTSDGTRRGTKTLKDIRPGPGHSIPDDLAVVGRTLYFTAATDRGRELWRSDGTRAGTVLVKDISADPGRAPGSLTAAGRRLYFVAADDLHGVELWTSDGTEAGTRMVSNLAPDAQYDARSSAPFDLVPAGDRLFFTATADGGPHELWVTDGTEAGTRQVTDRPVEGCDERGLCGEPRPLLGAPDGTLRFVVQARWGEVEGPELWYSDGTPEGTRLLDEFSPVPRWDPVIDDPPGRARHDLPDRAGGRCAASGC